MERLWIREVRRAARRASAPFARQIAFGCVAAAVGTMIASLLPLQLDGSAAQAAWAAVWAVAGYIAIWTGLFVGHLWRSNDTHRQYDLFSRPVSCPGCALGLDQAAQVAG